MTATYNNYIVEFLHLLCKSADKRTLGKIIILFRSHGLLFRICMIVISDKMQNSVNDNPVQLLREFSTIKQSVILYGIYADEEIAGKNVIFAVIKGDNIRKIVVLKIFHIYIKNVIV